MIKRRNFLKYTGAGITTAGVVYSLKRGIRYPTLSLETKDIASSIITKQATFNLTDLIAFPSQGLQNQFRAYAPEPSMTINHNSSSTLSLMINNISADAKLISNNSNIEETIKGISRYIKLSPNSDKKTKLAWQLPELDEYKFAAIGDTGGNRELEWCIKRAKQLGARFFLHLGDFNYVEGDYDAAIKLFHDAPIPCYVSIGNHDFHDSGLIYQPFLDYIGPLNNQFSINDIRYVNLDTAASFLPVSSGQRGKLIKTLLNQRNKYTDTVLFTHRPLRDPNIEANHDLGNNSEIDWLINSFKQININTLLCGHIHSFHDTMFNGIRQIIVGQGLGHQELAFKGNFSRIAIGTARKGQAIHYDFIPLNIPPNYNCHPKLKHFITEKRINSGQVYCEQQEA